MVDNDIFPYRLGLVFLIQVLESDDLWRGGAWKGLVLGAGVGGADSFVFVLEGYFYWFFKSVWGKRPSKLVDFSWSNDQRLIYWRFILTIFIFFIPLLSFFLTILVLSWWSYFFLASVLEKPSCVFIPWSLSINSQCWASKFVFDEGGSGTLARVSVGLRIICLS